MSRDIRKSMKYCRRCGVEKSPPRSNGTYLCLKCDAETSCVHYEPGGLDPTCAVFVDIAQLTAPSEGCVLRRPCYFIQGGTPVKCEKFTPRSEDELMRADQVKESHLRATLDVLAEVQKQTNGVNGDWSGNVTCPICGRQVFVSKSGFNGHVWGRCETEECLSWMM